MMQAKKVIRILVLRLVLCSNLLGYVADLKQSRESRELYVRLILLVLQHIDDRNLNLLYLNAFRATKMGIRQSYGKFQLVFHFANL